MKKLLSAVLLTALSTTAMAEGRFFSVDIGQSTAKDTCASLGAACTDSGTAYRIGGGYQFTPNLGVEASYGIMASAKASGVFGSAEYKPRSMQVSGTGKFPISGPFSLIGKVGLVRTTVDLSASNSFGSYSPSATTFNLGWGVGGQVDLADGLALRAQFEDLGEIGDANTTGTAKLTLLSLGITMNF